MIKILDYGMGNCGSFKNMLRYLGVESEIVDSPELLLDAEAIILPGVGAFDNGVKKLQRFRSVLEDLVIVQKVPFLGICLGMQLLFESSEEGELKGMDWISGYVRKFNFDHIALTKRLAIPHMGWNEVHYTDSVVLNKKLEVSPRFYFVHSYHVECKERNNILATASYGYEFTCAVQKENIFGVQFHPEKSHKFGKEFFKSFLDYVKC
jgi:glutamine amidotransferase